MFWVVFLFSIAIFPIVTIFSAAIALPVFALLQETYERKSDPNISSFPIAINVAFAIAFGVILFFYFDSVSRVN